MAEALITDELIAEMRAKAGLKLRIEHSINNRVATEIAISKFADGIGDGNPLWSDASYAAGTRFGGITAPPAWIICVFSGVQFGWRGLGGFHNASELEFYRPIMLHDVITPTCTFVGFEGPKRSEFAEKMIIDKFENLYTNQREDVVARIVWSVMRTERATARKKGKYRDIQLPHPWTEAELALVEAEVLAEAPRGAAVRCWEDVDVGEALAPVVKGPLGLTDELAFIAAAGAPIPRLAAHGVALRQYRRHPAWAFRDPGTHALEPIFSVHYNQAAARAMGLPLQYDVGFQRQCWQTHLLSNWIGDEGWIKQAAAEYRRFVYYSDVVRLSGKVVRKYRDAQGEPCVDIETYAINQRQEEVMPGRATVVLPSRDENTYPLVSRLPH